MKATATPGHAPLLDLLERARPFAEQLVYQCGVQPRLGATPDGHCDEHDEVREHFRLALLDRDPYHNLIRHIEETGDEENNDMLLRMQDCDFLLGIAVGMLLRGAR